MIPKLPSNTLIVIGGAPCVGKTSLAKQLGKVLGVKVLETDKYQKSLQKQLNPSEEPDLFLRRGLSASLYYRRYPTSSLVADMELRQATATSRHLLNKIHQQPLILPLIIEGLAVLPEVIERLATSEAQLIPIFLIQPNSYTLAKAIEHRGLWSRAWKYPAALKPLEIAGAIEIQNRLQDQLTSQKVIIIEVEDYHTTMEQTLLQIERNLQTVNTKENVI